MIAIHKEAEPPELKDLREWTIAEGYSPEVAYQTLRNPLKETVRHQLVREQGHLCAYCMCEIPRSDVEPGVAPIIIEHYIPRNPEDGRDVKQGLDYQNMLAVCNGNRTRSVRHREPDLTCDAHRENLEFKKVNPTVPDTLNSIFYTLDGKIDATDPDVREDLQITLNLNCPTSPLVYERKSALQGLLNDMGILEGDKLLDYCRERLQEFESETDPKTPYVGILLWYLKDMIRALTDA